MQWAICWSGSSHLHLLRQKSNCSSYIVTSFMDVLFGVIHTRTLLENLLSVIYCDTFKGLINVPRYTSSSLEFVMNATDHMSANLLTAWRAEKQFPLTLLLLPLSIVMHISSLHYWISEMYDNMYVICAGIIILSYYNKCF